MILKNKWLGLKFVVYDINTKIDNTDGNLYKVRMEIWIDKNAENTIKDSSIPQWELMNILIDKGNNTKKPQNNKKGKKGSKRTS